MGQTMLLSSRTVMKLPLLVESILMWLYLNYNRTLRVSDIFNHTIITILTILTYTDKVELLPIILLSNDGKDRKHGVMQSFPVH